MEPCELAVALLEWRYESGSPVHSCGTCLFRDKLGTADATSQAKEADAQ